MWSILSLEVTVITEPFDHSRCKTKNVWPSVATHCEEVVGVLSAGFLRIKTADTLIMGWPHYITLWLCKIQDQKLVRVHWHSFVGGSSNIITIIVAHKGRQHFDYRSRLLHSPFIMLEAGTKVDNAPLTLCLGDSSNVIAIILAYKAWQYFNSVLQRLSLCFIISRTTPRIVDAPLRHISTMRYWACWFPLYV